MGRGHRHAHLARCSLKTVASPAITGAPGDQIAFIGDMSGTFNALDLTTGDDLWTMASGAPFIYSSAAVSNGMIFVGTASGDVFALAPGATGGSAR